MDDLILLAVGIVVGTIGTLVGVGGGFLLVPILLFLYPDDPPSVTTSTSLAVVFINAVSGSIAYARLGRIDYRTGLILASITIPGSILGALTTTRIDREVFTAIFSLVLIAIALLLFRRPAARERSGMATRHRWKRRIVDRTGAAYDWSFPLPLAMALALLVGFLSSLLGIGGGVIQVPAFILLFNFPTYIATATSQFMLVIMSATGSLTHIASGEFGEAARRTLVLAPGVIVGSQIGAWLARRLKPALIARLLAALMIVAALRLLTAQLW